MEEDKGTGSGNCQGWQRRNHSEVWFCMLENTRILSYSEHCKMCVVPFSLPQIPVFLQVVYKYYPAGNVVGGYHNNVQAKNSKASLRSRKTRVRHFLPWFCHFTMTFSSWWSQDLVKVAATQPAGSPLTQSSCPQQSHQTCSINKTCTKKEIELKRNPGE